MLARGRETKDIRGEGGATPEAELAALSTIADPPVPVEAVASTDVRVVAEGGAGAAAPPTSACGLKVGVLALAVSPFSGALSPNMNSFTTLSISLGSFGRLSDQRGPW